MHQRMAELWTIRRQRKLSWAEWEELYICLEANMNLAWKQALLENFSLMASMTEDIEWQHEVCARIEKIRRAPDL